MINRRELLKGSAAVAVLVGFPAMGLAAPLPKASGLITPDMMLKEFISLMDASTIPFAKQITPDWVKLGDTLARSYVRGYSQFIVDKHDGADAKLQASELGLSMDDFSDKYIEPVANVMADSMMQEATEGKDIVCARLPHSDEQSRTLNYRGIAARLSLMYDIKSDAIFTRFDMLYGAAKRI